MRKYIPAMALMLVVFLVVGVASPAAGAPVRRRYVGELSNGSGIRFATAERRGGAIVLTGFSVNNLVSTCEDSTTMEFSFSSSFGIVGAPVLADGVRLDFDSGFGAESRYHIHGELRRRAGSGTLRYTAATLTEAEDSQTCTTGDLSWAVVRVRR
jgi:hypothetical protein